MSGSGPLREECNRAHDEAPPYPLVQGFHDQAISPAIAESARAGQDVRVAEEGWSR